MRFLIIFDSLSSEKWSSILRIISEFTHGCGFEVSVVATELIVSVDLVQCILVTEELVLGEVDVVPLEIEFISLLCCKVLTITPRMVPMMVF